MAQTPERKAEEKHPPSEPTPLERMTDLTRRIVNVPRSEVEKKKAKKRKR